MMSEMVSLRSRQDWSLVRAAASIWTVFGFMDESAGRNSVHRGAGGLHDLRPFGNVLLEDGGQLVIKKGRFGKFIGCANYPKCKHIEPLEKPRDTGVTCPVCKTGHLVEKKSRYGKLFYSCNTYPKCTYAVWNPPVAENCPQCGWPVLTIKTTKRRGTEKVCPQKECGWSEVIAPPAGKDEVPAD